jgi:hypothetical protein
LEVLPGGRRLRATRVEAGGVGVEVALPGLPEQPADDPLGVLVSLLPEQPVAEATVRVEDVECGPVLVAEGPPDREVVVDRDGVPHSDLLRGLTDVVEVPLEHELGGVDADQHQP